MRLRGVALIGVAVAALLGPVAVFGQTRILKSVANKPWPAPVKTPEPDKPPVLNPAQELATITMAPGYHAELVASEPLIHDPILAEYDGDGRLWVMEMQGFSINAHFDDSQEPVNDVVILEDTNHDGVFDKRTVFADGLILPRALKILDKNCALIGAPPNLIKACDTNGDGKADTREIIDKGFDRQGVVEHGANGLYWGMDNRLVVSEHTYDIAYKDGKFSPIPTLRKGQWGVTQDDGGRIYRNVNTDPLFVDYVAPQYYMRNPNLVRTDGVYQVLAKQEDINIWPIHPTKGVNRGYRDDIFRLDGTATYYGGVSSPMIYRGKALPKDIQGQPLVVDGPTNIVHLLKMTNDNGKLWTTDFYKKGEFMASTDIRFRPVALTPSYDGSFLVVDMYRGISQDGPIQTDYLRDFSEKHALQDGIHMGRIYRIVHDGMKTDPKPNMSKETPAQLVAHLSSPNGWWRDTAQQLLVQRADKSVVPALEKLATSAPMPETRLQAMWTLDGLGALQPNIVTAALASPSPDVRASAVRLSEHWLKTSQLMRDAVLKLQNDDSWFVRRQLAATLGEFPKEQRLAPILAMLQKYGSDSITVDAALSGIPGQENEALNALTKQANPSGDAIAMLAGAASKGRNPAEVQSMINMAGDSSRPAAIRVAVMKGLAMGLQGGAQQGGGGVAGGRAGGGVPGVTRARSTAGVPIQGEPTGIVAAAKNDDEMGKAAKATLALLDWPGKPAPPAVAPLTAEDQARFAAGKKIFDSTCAECHQLDGSGTPHIGAKLAGSKYATGPTDQMIRILVNGKEGEVGLMPPLGQALSDEELASVLTYVRRSFGNTGSPVVPAEAKETRQAYSHRTTPWSDAELATRRN